MFSNKFKNYTMNNFKNQVGTPLFHAHDYINFMDLYV